MGGFTLKTHQMFSVLTTREGFKNATISGYCAQTWKSYDYHNVIVFKKLLSKNVFVHTKPAFSDSFRKAPFSWRISVDGRSNRREKAVFSNYSGIVWMGPNFPLILMRFFFCANRGKLFPHDGKKAPSLITPMLYYHSHVHRPNLSWEKYQTNPTHRY